MSNTRIKNAKRRKAKRLLVLDECVKQFFPETSRMGAGEPSQWGQKQSLLSQKSGKGPL